MEVFAETTYPSQVNYEYRTEGSLWLLGRCDAGVGIFPNGFNVCEEA